MNINLVDEEDEEKIRTPVVSYDPQAPVTRKGILTSFRTGRPMPIKEEDVVIYILLIISVKVKFIYNFTPLSWVDVA